MASTMTPSDITIGQIGKIQEILGAALRKSGLQSDPTQVVLETQGDSLVTDLVSAIRKRVEAVSKMITRHVAVDRSLTPSEAIDKTGRIPWYIDEEVLAEMPRDGFERGNVELFELDYDPTVDELDRAYEARGLKPDPYATAQLMADDPAFADERPVAVQWRDKRKRACYAFFRRYGDERNVFVDWRDFRWRRDYRFAGVRK